MEISREELREVISEAVAEAARQMQLDNGIGSSSCASIMSVKDIAKELCVSMPTAYGLVQQDSFPAVKVGRKYVVGRDAFLRWLNCRKESATWHRED